MHGLVIALFSSILVLEYLVERREWFHAYLVLMPEALSAIAMLVVLVRVMNGTRLKLDWRYGAFFLALLFTITFGWAVQEVETGPILAGARSYLRYLPFFLLPAVHRFTPRQLHVQLMMLFVLALGQTPLAVYQRFVEFAERMHTGDPVMGTLSTSGALSMFMIATIGGAVVFFLRGRLRFTALALICGWLFLPTTINETKATLLLLPIALVVPALLMPRKTRPLRKLAPLLAVGAAAMVAFVLVYNTLIQNREYAGPISDYFTGETLRYYLYTGAADTDQPYVGRLDSIEIALEHTGVDPLKLAFGYGAGNVSDSFLPVFAGEYADYYFRYGVGQTQITQFLWDIGVVGLLAYLFLLYAVARDSLTLARSSDEAAPLGQIWTVAVIITTVGLVYKSVFSMTDFGYLFWYFSGVVAAQAAAVRQRSAKRVPNAPPAWRLAASEPGAAFKG